MIKVGLYFKYGCDGSELFRRTVKALGERGVEYRLVNDCGELAGLGAFPVFVTNAFDVYPLPESSERRRGGVILPIQDEAFYAVYYFVCRAADRPRFQKLIAGLQAGFRVQGF